MSGDDSDVVDEMHRRIRNIMRDVFDTSPFEEALYDLERHELRPLTQITETDDEVVVSIDLPCVAKENIEVKGTEDALTIKAKMTECVRIPVPGKREVEYETYRKTIKLPSTVDPTKAQATFKSGMLQIRLPKKSHGREISVG
jgi:HSP20 family protein